MTHEILQSIYEGRRLSSPSAVAATVVDLIDRAEPRVDALRSVIECDPVLTAKILREANQPEIASVRPVSTLLQAITLLGLEKIKAAVLTFTLAPVQASAEAGAGFDY